MRRPPNASGIEISLGSGNVGNGSKKRFCSAWRMITSLLFVVFLTFLFIQIRNLVFGASILKSSGAGLRANQNDQSINANLDAVKPG